MLINKMQRKKLFATFYCENTLNLVDSSFLKKNVMTTASFYLNLCLIF